VSFAVLDVARARLLAALPAPKSFASDVEGGGRDRGRGSGEPERDAEATLDAAETSVVESPPFGPPFCDDSALLLAPYVVIRFFGGKS
jgi:hypothetical protein